MSVASVNSGLLAALFGRSALQESVGAPTPEASPSANTPKGVEDSVSISFLAKAREQVEQERRRIASFGPAPEGSPWFGARTSDGLAIDVNGLAVVVKGTTVLIDSANGRKIQAWGDILNDTTNRYSDLDKAKAYKQLQAAFQADNPNFTVDEKRAAGMIAGTSEFQAKVSDLDRRRAEWFGPPPDPQDDDPGYARETASLRRQIAWHDAAEPWEREMHRGEREMAEGALLFFDKLETLERAGKVMPGVPGAAQPDPEARWLFLLYDRLGQVQSEAWKWGEGVRTKMAEIRDELAAGFKPSVTA